MANHLQQREMQRVKMIVNSMTKFVASASQLMRSPMNKLMARKSRSGALVL
jgi:hypothetical protein